MGYVASYKLRIKNSLPFTLNFKSSKIIVAYLQQISKAKDYFFMK